MRIPRSSLELALEPYFPNTRYLKSAEMKYPQATGKFSISQSSYIANTGHLNAADLLICYNQLTYSFFAEAGSQGLIPELGLFTAKEFAAAQLQHSLIVSLDNVRFKRPIDPISFEGQVDLLRAVPRKNGQLVFFHTSYDFNQGAATGNVDLVFVKN